MTISYEIKLKDFRFWSGAAFNASKLTAEELDLVEGYIEELKDYNEEPWTATEINDIFWFQMEDVCEWLGLDYEEVMSREKE